MLGGALAFASALTFALNNASFRRGALTGSVAQAMAITVPMGLVIFFFVALASGQIHRLAEFGSDGILWLMLAGVVHFVAGRYSHYRATKAMGGALVGSIQGSSLIVSLVLAVVVLGESVSLMQFIGIALVIAGPVVMRLLLSADEIKGRPSATPVAGSVPVFAPKLREGALFAALSALAFGISPILVGLGLRADLGAVGGVLGGLVSYIAATLVVAVVLLRPTMSAHVRTLDRGPAKWFMFSGALVCLSQMMRYVALAVAPVSVVVPILRTELILRLIFARLINPDHEVLGAGVVVGTVISLCGVVLISADIATVGAVLRLPDGVQALLAFSWP